MIHHNEDDYETAASKHALEIAESLGEFPEGLYMMPVDSELCAKLSRTYARRWQRCAVIAVAFAIAAALSVGLPDLNGDGRASLADFRTAAWGLLSMPSAAAKAAEDKS